MYRIMLVEKEGTNKYNSTYTFMTTVDSDGNKVFYEAADLTELDEKVESMLNGKYAKKDFIIVQVKDYNIDAKIATNTINESE